LLTFILAETALETVPIELLSHPAIRRHAKRKRKPPEQILLDRSFHHTAMKQLDNNEKRGRPDITHFILLEALGSPLNKEGLLQVHIQTNKDFIITVNPIARLPRNYSRFIGLMEQLFLHGKVPLEGEILLNLEKKSLSKLLVEIKPDYILAFSRLGKTKTIEGAVSHLHTKRCPAIIIGGFAQGHFSKATIKLVDEVVCIDQDMLEAWILTSRLIYEYERSMSLPEKRLNKSGKK
jgi:rRNA small subunit pseudouridine methyltransferase Nep1